MGHAVHSLIHGDPTLQPTELKSTTTLKPLGPISHNKCLMLWLIWVLPVGRFCGVDGYIVLLDGAKGDQVIL